MAPRGAKALKGKGKAQEAGSKPMKPPGSTLGVRRQTKVRPPMPRQEGLTDDQWQFDCLRRKLDTERRNQRRARQLATERAAEIDAINKAFAMGASEESVVAPVLRTRSGSSPSHSSYYQESATATPRSRFSPDYGDSEPGGFNPNAVFPPIQHRVAGLDLNQSYAVSPVLQRGSSSSGATNVNYQT